MLNFARLQIPTSLLHCLSLCASECLLENNNGTVSISVTRCHLFECFDSVIR